MLSRHLVSSSFLPLLILVSFLLLVDTRPAHADYYKYTDMTGVICISNTLDAVPLQYPARP